MCGIVGAVAKRPIEKILIEGLKRLEYRGYDSAGFAILNNEQKIKRLRTQGKVRELEKCLQQSTIEGYSGIAHTRWATHGVPSEKNAHPFISNDQIALVHNGIIENHEKLKKFLRREGYHFTSDTDTETVVHLLHYHYKKSNDLIDATKKTVAKLEGAYALGILHADHPERIIAVRKGSPLVLGKGIGENFFASDPLALLPITKEFIYLEDGDIADLYRDHVTIFSSGRPVKRAVREIDIQFDAGDRGDHRHYMSKEIFEQPQAILNHLDGRITKKEVVNNAFGVGSLPIFKKTKHVQFIACGTSYHACMVGRYWLEAIARIPCSVETASEFRYRKTVIPKNSLFVTLSQSGETADTLAALRLAKKMDFLSSLAICNVPESSLVRESALHFMTRAGIEMGVASTKAFTTQLTALLILTLTLAREHGTLSPLQEQKIISALHKMPSLMEKILQLNDPIAALAEQFVDKEHALFLGRGALYPIALEGALKLKEISYIHAEGYPAGELKHGPLALVDKNMPVIAVAPHDDLLEKLKSNLQEVRARGGELFLFTDSIKLKDPDVHIIQMPKMDSILAPILYTIPLQLLAYHVAVLKGTDVDQPRNLAKSVTVE